jgi:hypothetical protein
MDIIIARYNENVKWLLNAKETFDKIHIYNKGEPFEFSANNVVVENLSNIGREAHTYLHFIVSNYEEIERTPNKIYIFSQADPNNGLDYFNRKIESLSTKKITDYPVSLTDDGAIESTEPHLGSQKDDVHPKGIPFEQYFSHLFYTDKKKQQHQVYYHALWATRGADITFRKKDFYQYCYGLFDNLNNPIESYIFERLWQYIFNPSYLDWISHYAVIRNLYTGGRWHGLEIK